MIRRFRSDARRERHGVNPKGVSVYIGVGTIILILLILLVIYLWRGRTV
jgi:hypothetical protein